MSYLLQIPLAERPLLSNQSRRLHFHVRAQRDAVYRQLAFLHARKVPKLDPLAYTVEFRAVYKRKPLPDPHAIDPTAKAMLDGLVDAGVFPDDKDVEVTYRRPVVDKTWQGIEIRIVWLALGGGEKSS